MVARALIAIVDDDISAREAMVSLVAAMGFEAQGFDSAIAFLHSGSLPITRCLIADIRMPGMGGLDLYRHLAARGRPLPTFLVTAYPDEMTRMLALAVGVHGYLAKPFDPDDLLACLREALRQA